MTQRPPDDLLNDPWLKSVPVVEGFKVLDPAVLYAKVGQGGMGAVYRGRHFKLDLDVAVKMLKPSLVEDAPDFVKRFQREARLAASITHQNVVHVMDVYEKHGVHYLVMEFVQGETARERVRRKDRLAEAEALAILLGATTGLCEAHRRGIVHRDIKPDNVMISVEGRVKLADLGLAKASQGVEDQSLSMHTTGIMGTPQFMPPEQWDTSDVTPAADIWALGATLYFLLTGQSGIPAGSMAQVAERIRHKDFPSARTLRPDVSEPVHTLLERCVRRAPEERFVDASALLKALRLLPLEDEEQVLKDPDTGRGTSRLGVVSPPPRQTLARIRLQVTGSEPRVQTAEGPPTLRQRRPRAGVWTALAAVLLLVVAGYGAFAGWFRSADTGSRPAPRRAAETPGPVGPEPRQPAAGATAQDAYDRAMAALPKPGGLDAAIQDFELALSLDPKFDRARGPLARALKLKAEKLEPQDLDAAYERLLRAGELVTDDAALAAWTARLRQALCEQLLKTITVTETAADAPRDAHTVRVRGRVTTAPKALRLVLDARPDAVRLSFPEPNAPPVQLVAGEFDETLSAKADGKAWVRIEAEEVHGLRAECTPISVYFDTADPVLSGITPAADTLVPATVTLSGRVVETTAVTVTVNGLNATVTGDTWSREVTLAHGPQQIEIVAEDALHHRTVVRHPLRVDAHKPEIRVTAPEYTNQDSVQLTGTVTDDSPVTLTVDGRPATLPASVPLTEDKKYTLQVVARDAVGNEAWTEVTVTRCTQPPVLAWTAPETTAPLPAGEVLVSGTVQSPQDGVTVQVNGVDATVTGSKWQHTVTLGADQRLAVRVTARDPAGNVAKEELKRTLVGAPAIAWGQPDGTVQIDGKESPRVRMSEDLGLILVPPGSFQMGSDKGAADEKPVHTVRITKGYWLAETEVTQKQWRDVMGTEPWKGRSCAIEGDRVAASYVSWTDAMAFCRKLNEKYQRKLPEGYFFQLPTEAEWERACRAGSPGEYCSGNDAGRLGDYAVYADSRDGEHAHAVKSRKPNAWGFFDMHGNVREWVADGVRFQADGVPNPTYVEGVVDPLSNIDSRRVCRGGSWMGGAKDARSGNRYATAPGNGSFTLGFRPVLAVRHPG